MKPGSREAINHGCLCPQIDNHHGEGYRGDPTRWLISQRCPMHSTDRTVNAALDSILSELETKERHEAILNGETKFSDAPESTQVSVILLAISGDRRAIEAVMTAARPADIYRFSQSILLRKPVDEVTHAERDEMKRRFFVGMYGARG